MMISRDITVDGITYTVSATTLRGLDEAIVYLQDSLKRDQERKADELAEELSNDFNQLLEDIDTGKIELPSRVDQPDQESEVKPAEPTKPKLSARKKKND